MGHFYEKSIAGAVDSYKRIEYIKPIKNFNVAKMV